MADTSVIFVGDNGWTDMAPDLPETRMTSAHGFHQPWWKDVRIYHRNGYVYEVEAAKPETELPALSKVLAATLYNPTYNIAYEYRSTGFYQLDDLKKAVDQAIDADDDVLTQFHEAEELHEMVAKANSFDDVVEVLVYAASEVLNI